MTLNALWQDHAPSVITVRKGAPSGALHGSSGPGFDPNWYYIWRNGAAFIQLLKWLPTPTFVSLGAGQMHNGVVVCNIQLVDHPAGSGGLCVVPGSRERPNPKHRSARAAKMPA